MNLGKSTRRSMRPQRRGSVYLLVLGLAMLVTVIGLGAVAVTRLTARTVSEGKDFTDARTLAFSAAEHAITRINADSNWRSTFNGQTITQSLGRGTFSWYVTDETDNNLTDNASDPYVIWATGNAGRATYSMRVHMAIPASVSGIGVNTALTVNGSTIDSYDSTNGDYGGANVGSSACMGTNSTTAGTVVLSNSARVNGSLNVGPNGNPATVISKDGTSTISGPTAPMAAAIAMPTITAPTNLGASQGNVSYQGNHDTTLTTNMHVQTLTVKSNAKLYISGNVTILADGDVLIQNTGGVEVLPGGSLTIYVQGALTIQKKASVDGMNLSRMECLVMGTTPVTLSGSSMQGVIIAPNAAVNMSSAFNMYGAIIAKSLSMSGGSGLHEDKRITSQVDRVTLPGTSKPRADSISRVVQ